MKRNFTSILALAFLLPALAQAADLSAYFSSDFTGHWRLTGGKMQAKYLGAPSGAPVACSLIDMQISLTAQALTIDSYHSICGALESKWGPYPMELRGTEVYTDGEKAGTFDGTQLDVRLRGGYYLKFELAPPAHEGDAPVLKTLYGVTNVMQAIEISGELPQVGQ